MDTEYVLRGGPGQAAKLKGEPFPEDVLTGLNVEVVEPNRTNTYSMELNFDNESTYILNKNPEKAPYRNMGWFLFKNIVAGEEKPGYGCVWQWVNSDGSFVYITVIISQLSPGLVLTPFARLDYEAGHLEGVPVLKEIAYDPDNDRLLHQWAEKDEVPAKLQGRASIMSLRFP